MDNKTEQTDELNYLNKQVRNLIDRNSSVKKTDKDRLTPRAYRELIQVQEHIRKAISEINKSDDEKKS